MTETAKFDCFYAQKHRNTNYSETQCLRSGHSLLGFIAVDHRKKDGDMSVLL